MSMLSVGIEDWLFVVGSVALAWVAWRYLGEL